MNKDLLQEARKAIQPMLRVGMVVGLACGSWIYATGYGATIGALVYGLSRIARIGSPVVLGVGIGGAVLVWVFVRSLIQRWRMVMTLTRKIGDHMQKLGSDERPSSSSLN